MRSVGLPAACPVGVVPLKEREANQRTGKFFHDYENLVKVDVSDLEIVFVSALWSLLLSVSNHYVEVWSWALFYN